MIRAGIGNLGHLNAQAIMANGRDLIATAPGSTFTRAGSRYSQMNPGVILGNDVLDTKMMDLFPEVSAQHVACFSSTTRLNDRDLSTWVSTNLSVVMATAERGTLTQVVAGNPVNLEWPISQSNNQYCQFHVQVYKTSNPIRFESLYGAARGSYTDFDPATGVFTPVIAYGGGTTTARAYITDDGAYWSVLVMLRANNSYGPGRAYIRFITAPAGSTSGVFTPVTLDFMQVLKSGSGQAGPYIPGAGTNIACGADILHIDIDPSLYPGATEGELMGFVMPTWWGISSTAVGGNQGNSNQYILGWADLVSPAAEPWRTFHINLSNAGGGSLSGGGNASRGNGINGSISAYSGTQANYWVESSRQWISGAWNADQVQIVFNQPTAPYTTNVLANIPGSGKPTYPILGLNLYPFKSANSPEARVAIWGWGRRLSRAERSTLSRALLRGPFPPTYP